MPRPISERRVGSPPAASVFKPAGIPARELEETNLSLDELEALRLADYVGLYQEAAALRMGVSRQTFGRIVESARRKVAEALIEGRALRIGGGVVTQEQGERSMKIAVPSRDGEVDGHFGHCAYFTVFTVEDGKIAAEDKVESPESCGCKSGIAGELARGGVTKLIAGNIGEGAVRVLGSYGIEVLRGASGKARKAVEDYLAGVPFEGGANCAEHHEGCHHED
jgi:predicted DNA-binding protein (UPF0251 family)/predicted Fe-Mo cluster-binding NifX family protein